MKRNNVLTCVCLELFPYLQEILNEYRYYEVYKADLIIFKIIDTIMFPLKVNKSRRMIDYK